MAGKEEKMNLAEYMKLRKSGEYVPTLSADGRAASVETEVVEKVALAERMSYDDGPVRGAMIVPDDMRGFVRRYTMQRKRCMGQKPRYKQVRRGGARFRKHF